MSSDIILVIVVVTAVAFDFTNGFHDAANVVATALSTRAITWNLITWYYHPCHRRPAGGVPAAGISLLIMYRILGRLATAYGALATLGIVLSVTIVVYGLMLVAHTS